MKREAALKKLWLQILCAVLVLGLMTSFYAPTVFAQNPSPEELKHKVELYLRNMFAFGPETKLLVGDFKETGMPGVLATTISVTIEGNKEDAKMWVSKDGKFLFRGELNDMSKDMLAENRAKLDIKDAPATGNLNGPITVVEFADFECPVCRNLHEVLRGLLPKYPQVRLLPSVAQPSNDGASVSSTAGRRRIGGRMPAHCTGVGKAMLAFSPRPVLEHVLAAGLVRRTPRTVIAPGLLDRELAAVLDHLVGPAGDGAVAAFTARGGRT